jgi:hypothetical protein
MNLPRKLITSKGGQPIPFTIVNRIAGISSLLNFIERGKEQKINLSGKVSLGLR